MSEELVPSHAVATERLLYKDLLVPISIIIAGMFIGAGMYFSGGVATPTQPSAVAQQGNQAPGTTEKINPVDENDYIKGDINAPVVIVEYSDFDCPFCSRFHDTMNEIVSERDDVAWVYRHFPLEQLHPQAPAVAVASECVGALGGNDAFWAFTDGYFTARGAGDSTAHAALINRLVAEAGVNQAAFSECFESGEFEPAVEEDYNNAAETGGRGTPWSVVIGPNGKTYPLNGAVPKQSVEQVIEVALNEA